MTAVRSAHVVSHRLEGLLSCRSIPCRQGFSNGIEIFSDRAAGIEWTLAVSGSCFLDILLQGRVGFFGFVQITRFHCDFEVFEILGILFQHGSHGRH